MISGELILKRNSRLFVLLTSHMQRTMTVLRKRRYEQIKRNTWLVTKKLPVILSSTAPSQERLDFVLMVVKLMSLNLSHVLLLCHVSLFLLLSLEDGPRYGSQRCRRQQSSPSFQLLQRYKRMITQREQGHWYYKDGKRRRLAKI